MKLYEVPQNTWVKIIGSEPEFTVLFDHIDGMYSYCLDSDKNIVHLQAWTEVEIVDTSLSDGMS